VYIHGYIYLFDNRCTNLNHREQIQLLSTHVHKRSCWRPDVRRTACVLMLGQAAAPYYIIRLSSQHSATATCGAMPCPVHCCVISSGNSSVRRDAVPPSLAAQFPPQPARCCAPSFAAPRPFAAPCDPILCGARRTQRSSASRAGWVLMLPCACRTHLAHERETRKKEIN
jgi:hypothetical protein